MAKENSSYKCLSLIMLDSVIRGNEKYYLQPLLEECKYALRKNKMENHYLDPSLYDNKSDSESDNGFDNESDNDESND